MKTVQISAQFFLNINGNMNVSGRLIGGCIDVFMIAVGTEIWPTKEEWQDKILLIETSEDKMPSSYLTWFLRNLGAQGIFNLVKGIIVGKPAEEAYYEEYKDSIIKVLKEYNCETLPVLYNLNIGHSYPTGIIPLGTDIEVDFDNKKIVLVKSPTIK